MKYLNLYKKIAENRIRNSYSSKFIIYEVEPVYSSGAYYFKVFLINRTFDGALPKRLNFSIQDSGHKIQLNSIKFALVSEFNDKNIFGCLLALEKNLSDIKNDLICTGYIDDKDSELSFDDHIVISELSLYDPEKYQVIKSLDPKFILFPTFTPNYWICECGCISSNHVCDSCGSSKTSMSAKYPSDIDSFLVNLYRKSKPLVFDVNKMLSDNLNSYFAPIGKLVNVNECVSSEELKQLETDFELQVKEKIREHKDQKPIRLDFSLSFEQNISDYLRDMPIHDEARSKVFDAVELKELETKYLAGKKESKKKNKSLLILFSSVSSVAVLVSIAYFGFIQPAQNYEKAVALFESGSYAQAEEIFAKLGDYQDSKAKLLETRYQWAIELLEIGNYVLAEEHFSQLGDYKDSATMVTESIYRQATAKYELYKDIFGYKDSELKYYQKVYLLALETSNPLDDSFDMAKTSAYIDELKNSVEYGSVAKLSGSLYIDACTNLLKYIGEINDIYHSSMFYSSTGSLEDLAIDFNTSKANLLSLEKTYADMNFLNSANISSTIDKWGKAKNFFIAYVYKQVAPYPYTWVDNYPEFTYYQEWATLIPFEEQLYSYTDISTMAGYNVEYKNGSFILKNVNGTYYFRIYK